MQQFKPPSYNRLTPILSFDDQVRAALDNATTSLREHLEAELHAFAQEVVRVSMEERQLAVAAASQAATAEVRAQAEALVADVRSQAEAQVLQFPPPLRTRRGIEARRGRAEIGELRKALEELRAQTQQQLDAARRTVQDEIERARAEVEKARAEAQTGRQRPKPRRRRPKPRTPRSKPRTPNSKRHTAKRNGRTLKFIRRRRRQSRLDARKVRAEIEAVRAEIEDARNQAKSDIARVQAEADEVRRGAVAEAEEALTARLEEALTARLTAAQSLSEQKTTEAIERAHADSHQAEVARAARFADAIRNLDEARGLSEVLERLVQSAGFEVDRAAMLLVKGDRLTGWRLAGFAPDGPSAKSIDLSIGDAGLAGAVLESHVPVSRLSDAADAPALPPFAADAGGGHAMALPVRVGGEVVAVPVCGCGATRRALV